jgi:uncharacterized OB-fold protein
MRAIEQPAMLKITDFPGGHDSRTVRPNITADSRPHHDGLAEGRLMLPRCAACQRVAFPATPLCTWCGSESIRWFAAAGTGRVHSWVRYHRAYLPEFAPLVPYVVLAVRLDEGPVLFGRLLAADAAPRIDGPARAVVERWADGFCGLAFELEEDRP